MYLRQCNGILAKPLFRNVETQRKLRLHSKGYTKSVRSDALVIALISHFFNASPSSFILEILENKQIALMNLKNNYHSKVKFLIIPNVAMMVRK